MNLYQRCVRKLAWLQFDDGCRVELYRSLSLFLRNQVQLNEAIKKMISIYGGDNPNCQNPTVHALWETIAHMENGLSFSESIADWVPAEEVMMLDSGEASGRLLETFGAAIELIGSKQAIKGAVVGAAAYPCLLLLMASGLLYMVSTSVVTKMAQMVPMERWTGSALLLAKISSFTTHYGLGVLVGLGTFAAWIYFSLPWRGGQFRIWLDKIPPWSIYRMVQGASFLLNIASLLSSGQQLNVALEAMQKLSSPWLRERLQGVQTELAKGKNFGRALCDCGYGFPDPEANQFLAVVSEYSGAEKAMADIGQRWMQISISKINSISSILSAGGLGLVGGVMILVVLGASGLQDAMQQSATSGV